MEYKVQIIIKPLEQIANPEGKTIERALGALSFDNVKNVRVGKVINFTLVATDKDQANETIQAICKKLLVNPVMEYFEIFIDEIAD